MLSKTFIRYIEYSMVSDNPKGNVAEHPVVKALAGSINTYKLSKTWFLKLLDRRVWTKQRHFTDTI